MSSKNITEGSCTIGLSHDLRQTNTVLAIVIRMLLVNSNSIIIATYMHMVQTAILYAYGCTICIYVILWYVLYKVSVQATCNTLAPKQFFCFSPEEFALVLLLLFESNLGIATTNGNVSYHLSSDYMTTTHY